MRRGLRFSGRFLRAYNGGLMNFDKIIKLNGKNVRRIIKKITNEENEDLEQEVYLRVYKNSEKYKEEGAFKSWINMIARNVSFDYLKSSVFKKETLNSAEDETVFLNVKDKKLSPEELLIQKERQKRILNEVDKLKPKLREVIVLTEFYGLSYEDTAKRLNCPVGTIKSRIFNAKKELMTKLSDLI